jgi:Stage II sporulation protein E (SpoIIE)
VPAVLACAVIAALVPAGAGAQTLPDPGSLPSPPSVQPPTLPPTGGVTNPLPPSTGVTTPSLPTPTPTPAPTPPPTDATSPTTSPSTPPPSPPTTTDPGAAAGDATSVVGNTVSGAANTAGNAVSGAGTAVNQTTTTATTTANSVNGTANGTVSAASGTLSGAGRTASGVVSGVAGGGGLPTGGTGRTVGGGVGDVIGGVLGGTLPTGGGGGGGGGSGGGGLLGGVLGGGSGRTAGGGLLGDLTVIDTTAGPRFVPVAPGTADLLTGAGANPDTVGTAFTDPLGTTLFGGPASGDTLVTSSGTPDSFIAAVAAGRDPQIGVIGLTPAPGAPVAYGLTSLEGLMTPAGLVAAVNGPPGATNGPGDEGGKDVITQIANAVHSVIVHLPDWSRPIIAALLLLLLLFGVHAWRTTRAARKTSRQNKYMQDALVPDPPAEIAGLSLSGDYRPADEVAQGGDFYDAFALDDHRVAVLLGDVSGHDLRALERSNAVRHKLRTLIEEGYEEGWELRRVLEKASRALSKQWLEGDFVTAAVAIYDAQAGTLTYACAGHPAPVINGAAAHDPVSVYSSPALGWGLPTGHRQTTVSFADGDTACFYTDGLIEARVKGSFLGRDGLERLVGELGEAGTAKDLLRSVIRLAHEAEDDLAAMVVRPTASVRPHALRVEELEFDASDVRRRAVERFLAACDAPAEVIERLAASANAMTADGARALLRVSFLGEDGVIDATIVPAQAPAVREPVFA